MIDESWYRRPPGMPAHDAAGGVVVRKEAGRIYVALVREDDSHSYILPKGHIEPGESLEVAARREIEEEAGLSQLRVLGELGMRERMDYAKRGWKRTHYFLFATDQTVGRPTDASRVYRLVWLPIDGPLPMLWPEQRELIESSRQRIAELLA